MLLNRRKMLLGGIGAVALSLTGCKNTKTVVVLINASNAPTNGPAAQISVSLTGSNGMKFSKSNLQPGHQYSQTYRSNDASGTVVSFTGTGSFGTPAKNFNVTGGTVTEGQVNTFTFDGVGITPSSNASITIAVPLMA